MKRIIFTIGVILSIVLGATGVQAQAGSSAQCGTDSNCVFVTKDTWAAMYLGGLEGADQKCAQAAQAAGLPGTYKAWLSDHAISAASRLTHSSAPYKLTDGTVIAKDWTDLTDGTLAAPIHLSEARTEPNTGRLPWTNTTANGSVLDARGTRVCDDWKGNPPYRANQGNQTKADAGWTQFTSDQCTASGHLYCFQQGPASAAPTHQIVRINNATPAQVKISYYSPNGQKWEDLEPNKYSDMDVAKGPAGNFLVKIVSAGSPNASNTQLTTPPANPTHQIVLVENATAAKVTVSFYSPGGQKWEALEPGAKKDVDVARGPAGHILIQVVPNQ